MLPWTNIHSTSFHKNISRLNAATDLSESSIHVLLPWVVPGAHPRVYWCCLAAQSVWGLWQQLKCYYMLLVPMQVCMCVCVHLICGIRVCLQTLFCGLVSLGNVDITAVCWSPCTDISLSTYYTKLLLQTRIFLLVPVLYSPSIYPSISDRHLDVLSWYFVSVAIFWSTVCQAVTAM